MSMKKRKSVLEFPKIGDKEYQPIEPSENGSLPTPAEAVMDGAQSVSDTTNDVLEMPTEFEVQLVGDDDEDSRNGIRLPIHADFVPPPEMLNSVEQQVKDMIPRLVRGVRYTAKILCGKAFWKPMEKGERILAGVCLSYLVAKNRLPLVDAGMNSSHSKVYELK
ncbi:MAG: hypothetical protein NTX56_04625 [Proteobacteria bacterium]|nr:hypothetical protein [Pseudomonadota bacterium]